MRESKTSFCIALATEKTTCHNNDSLCLENFVKMMFNYCLN